MLTRVSPSVGVYSFIPNKTTHTIYFTDIPLNFSTMTTLGKEESGRCREVETRVNVWTVCPPKNGCCGEVAVSGVEVRRYKKLPMGNLWAEIWPNMIWHYYVSKNHYTVQRC